MLITIAVCAMAEVARPLRFLNLPFVLWLIVAPWLLAGATAGSTLNDVVAGLVVIGSSLPRGHRSKEHYGSRDRYSILQSALDLPVTTIQRPDTRHPAAP